MRDPSWQLRQYLWLQNADCGHGQFTRTSCGSSPFKIPSGLTGRNDLNLHRVESTPSIPPPCAHQSLGTTSPHHFTAHFQLRSADATFPRSTWQGHIKLRQVGAKRRSEERNSAVPTLDQLANDLVETKSSVLFKAFASPTGSSPAATVEQRAGGVEAFKQRSFWNGTVMDVVCLPPAET